MSTNSDFNELKARKQLGRNIRALRKMYGVNQEVFAKFVKVEGNRHWLGRIERGTCNLAAVDLPAIAQALQVTPEELVLDDVSENIFLRTGIRFDLTE